VRTARPGRKAACAVGACLWIGVGAGLAHGQEPGNVTPTTSFASSSTTTPNADCELTLRLYNPVELAFVSFAAGVRARNCRSDIPGLVLTDQSGYLEVTGFPAGFRGPADLVTCFEEVHHSFCTPLLEDFGVLLIAYGGPDGELPEPPEICAARFDCDRYECQPRGARVADICGDADDSGVIRALDALAILRASVDLQECPPVRCDADRDGAGTASDALLVLRASIGIEVVLVCPPPCEPWAPE
jgi:hypothetical protein